MKAPRNATRESILRLLNERGPLPRSVLEQEIGRPLQATLSEMLRKRIVHINSWLRGGGNMRSPRMVYGVGDHPDAPRLQPDPGKHRRYYVKHKAKIAEKRKLNGFKYRKQATEAQRRRRAKNMLVTNPFLQLAPEIFRDLKRRASRKPSKGVPAERTRRYTTFDTRDGGGVGRTWTGVRQTESGELASAPPDQQAG